MEPLARRERGALCDLALLVGADAPTLCAGWSARDLLAHLLVRETRPIGALGIMVPGLSGLAERSMTTVARRPWPDLVAAVREPAWWTPFALRPVEVLANTQEYVVHHEDLRRAQPDAAPRELADEDDDLLWRGLRRSARLLLRGAGAPVLLQRTRGGSVSVGRGPAVAVSGSALELTLFAFGRQAAAEVDVAGPPEAVARVTGADLGM